MRDSNSRETILAALKALPDEANLALPVPVLRSLLSKNEDGDLLSVEDVGKLTKRSPGAVRSWIRAGLLSASMVGRRYMIRRNHFNEFLQQEPSITENAGSVIKQRSEVAIGAWRNLRGRSDEEAA